MKIQEQKWHDFTRLLIAEYSSIGIIGSIQVELYPEPQDDYGTTAYIHGLWVDEKCRGMRFAKRLMSRAEEEICKRGHKIVALKWNIKDTPLDIFRWYIRLGYDEKEFDVDSALMVKNFEENNPK